MKKCKECGAEDAETIITRIEKFNRDYSEFRKKGIYEENQREICNVLYGMKEMLEWFENMDKEWERRIIEHCDFVLGELGQDNKDYMQGIADMEKVMLKGFEERKEKIAKVKEALK